MGKIIALFEEHVEKIILGVVVLVCVWLGLFHVLLSPNKVTYENKNYGPGTVDKQISRQTEPLEHILDGPPQQTESNKSSLAQFLALLDSAVTHVDTKIYAPQPYISSVQPTVKHLYGLPEIGPVSDVAVEHIRAVAYVPTQEVTEQNPYDKTRNEPNDVDLVTVEANFDVTGLNQKFQESFTGDDVPAEWRDPCLARPVFASVQLERQELNPDGTWNQWEIVPRTKIDHLRRLFESTQTPGNLPAAGMKLLLVQFDNRDVAMNLLQPPAYQIASAREEWFPPSLHKKYVKLRDEQQAEEKRKALEDEKKAREERLEQQRAGTPSGYGATSPGSAYSEDLAAMEAVTGTRTRTRNPGRQNVTGLSPDSGRLREPGRMREPGRLRDGGGAAGTTPQGYSSGARRGQQDDRDAERERMAKTKEFSIKQSMNELYTEFNRILINPRTDLTRLREQLLFWAHDDTCEPKKTYRYRIRLGVFNPVAVGSKPVGGGKTAAASTILWSEYSEPTEAVTVPGVLYFFAKELQEAEKRVTVQISRYMMGYWYSKDFPVWRGESIGKPVETALEETKPVKGTRLPANLAYSATPSNISARPGTPPPTRPSLGDTLYYGSPQDTLMSMEPKIIEYSTGAVLVDVMRVSDWIGGGGRNMLARHYFDMLYSFDGVAIEHMPIDSKYWAADVRAAYMEIQTSQKGPHEALKPWGTRGTGLKQIPTSITPGYGGPQEDELRMMEEMMMEEEMMMQQRRGGRP
jgi:hypothetical protein